MRSRKTQAIAGLLAVGALFAGCGGGPSDEEYQAELEGALAPLEDLQDIELDPSSPEGLAEGLGQFEGALQSSIDELEGVEVPDDYQEQHDRLVGAFVSFQEATATAREGAESGGIQEVGTEFSTAAVEFQQQVTEIGQEFEDAGLEVEPQPTE